MAEIRQPNRWRPTRQKLFGSSRRIYVIMAAAALLFGVAAFIIGLDNFYGQLLNSIAQSFLVALILALLVDPHLKVTGFRETASEISERYFWETTSPNCPPEYRERIKELAAWQIYGHANFSNVRFSWADEARTIVRLEITRSGDMQNTSSQPYRPSRLLWLLASTPGHESQYNQWLLKIRNIGFNEVVEEGALRPHMSIREDGAVIVDEGSLARTFTDPPAIVPPNAEFETKVQGTMYRRNRGYLPIVHRFPISQGRLRCSGPALADLEVRCMFSGVHLAPRPAVDDGSITFFQPGLSTPGEGFLLSWKCRSD